MTTRRKTNYFYSIISVALVLFLLGFFGTALLFARQQTLSQQEKMTMMIEIKDGADSLALDSLKMYLEAADFVKIGSLKFVSKEEVASYMQKNLGYESLPDMPIPYFDNYSINLNTNRHTPDSIAAISARLKENLAVSDAYMQEGQEISKTLEKMAYFAFGMALLFIIVAITLIHNTIRINLYSDRFTIKNMELVGASWGFISRPYRRRSIWHGILSALIAIGLISAIWFSVQKSAPELNNLLKSTVFWASIVGLILLGIFISWLSTYFVVNKYLKMRLDDLY